MTPRLKTRYNEEIAPALFKELGVANRMLVPTFEKIVVNVGCGEGSADRKVIDGVMEDLSIITGQKPRVNQSRKSIANFKLRDGQSVGASVTMRGDRMWEFLDRLIAVAIPRIRDFRGLNPDVIRRARQLHVRRYRAAHFPGNRLRQGQCDSWHGHHDCDVGSDGRTRQSPPGRIWLSVPQAAGSGVGEITWQKNQ